MGRAHKDARKFLSKYSQTFSDTMPLAIFASGPLQPEDDWNEIRKMLARDLSVYPWLKPAAVEVFGGKYDPAKLQFPYTLLPAMKNMPASDLRDWESIHNWAVKVADLFQTILPK
jgi:menaquinone-dependent protoporphyrinogen oxidase